MGTSPGNREEQPERREQRLETGQAGQQDYEGRYENMPISWRQDRETLRGQIWDLISWRREQGFPAETDEEMVSGILSLVEAQRLRNMGRFKEMLKEASHRGESTEQATVEILRAWMRNAAREIGQIESDQGDRREDTF